MREYPVPFGCHTMVLYHTSKQNAIGLRKIFIKFCIFSKKSCKGAQVLLNLPNSYCFFYKFMVQSYHHKIVPILHLLYKEIKNEKNHIVFPLDAAAFECLLAFFGSLRRGK
jgi:hypothetical protein